IGYDWLYKDLAGEARDQIKHAIIEKGIRPSLESKNTGFLKVKNNWNQVCNAGIAYGAIAIMEDEPLLASTIINRAIKSIQLPMEDYAPDGAYPEGYNYWGYGTSFNVLFINALEQIAGTDFNLSNQKGFMATADYYLHMSGPTGQPFNYSDATASKELEPAMFWFANKRKDPSLLLAEQNAIRKTNTKGLIDNRLLPALLIWSIGKTNKDATPATLNWIGGGKTPVSLMRSSWTDPGAVFIGIKGGSADASHAHMDIGSFVMESDGVRWAIDPGMQEYESLESKGLNIFKGGVDSDRWKVYRNTNYIHNTLTVDSQLQQLKGKAEIISSSVKQVFPFAVIDLK
ncbi:MAG: heparinase, partial [Pedobacter sp.]